MSSVEGLRPISDTIEWRRSKVLELSSQGYGQREIANILQIGKSTINRDIMAIRQQARQNIRKYIDERLPEEYEKCLVGLNSIVKEAWTTSHQTHDRREKIQALSLAKDCYAMKLDLLTNATVVDDAIRFVTSKVDSNRNRQPLVVAVKPKTDASLLDSTAEDSDIQGPEEASRCQGPQEDTEYLSTSRGEGDTTTTTNSVF